MKVKIIATYSWTEEVSDDDLLQICDDQGFEPDDGKYDEDQLDEAFRIWQSNKETAIEEDTANISDDAILDVEIKV